MYLGIKIVPEIENIVSLNYDPVQSVTESIHRWMPMHISILGRISILKISILAKFLYLFQCIPLPSPQTFFCNIRKLFSSFIWNNRRPRFRLSLLYLPYERGGLQVPNLQWYYWAAQLCTAMFYFRPLNLLHG